MIEKLRSLLKKFFYWLYKIEIVPSLNLSLRRERFKKKLNLVVKEAVRHFGVGL